MNESPEAPHFIPEQEVGPDRPERSEDVLSPELVKSSEPDLPTKDISPNEKARLEAEILKKQEFIRSALRNFRVSENDIDDLTQEVLIKALKYVGSFRKASGLQTWLYTIARNTAFDFFRNRGSLKKKGEVLFGDLSEERVGALIRKGRTVNANGKEMHTADPSRVLVSKEGVTHIQKALSTLPEDQRIVLELFADGKSYKEIAEITGVPPGTVMSRLYYGRQNLRKALGREK
jgi:RNA polymerase sigma-70 factor (ECF subfamily)